MQRTLQYIEMKCGGGKSSQEIKREYLGGSHLKNSRRWREQEYPAPESCRAVATKKGGTTGRGKGEYEEKPVESEWSWSHTIKLSKL